MTLVFVQRNKAKLGIGQCIDHLTSEHHIASVGTCGWYVIADSLGADHKNTSQCDVSVMRRDVHDCLGDPLLGGQLLV